ncbi:MFS transporter [Bacillus ginsengihumi]|uniref:MFS transporter n=1 Tax=Heyndrickxia ginsengihumi TaxID=363870 RepID=A0A0A6VCW6_9BACI|nr:MFS transporter [Heyndrickxia ginsengihumi]KHD86140.1 MFS transporter [Heyndrickxia ginsengihumi]MCM3024078.1 MFS transporter [Heyndrickxia ginsengihumi]NEY21080.1 MFS transporter [Heyndrickxia ginsengihumi]
MEKQTSGYRWVVFATVLFSYFLIVSQRTAPGLISDQLMHDFHLTASTIGLLTGIQFLAYAGLQIPIGLLSDRFGPNPFLIIGTLLNGLGTLLYSIAQNETVLILSRLLVGLGDATIWVNLVLILSQWFKVNEFVGLLSWAGMTGSFGSMMATVPFTKWIALSGWRPPFFIVGFIIFIAGITLYYVLIKKPQQLFATDRQRNSESLASVKKEKRESIYAILKRMFTTRQAWATFFCHFGVVGTYVGFIGTWAVPYGMHVYGLTRSGSSQLIMLGLIGAIVGAPLTGWISNRLSSRKKPYIVVQIIIFLSWTSFVLLGGKPPMALLIILFLIIGYGNGASALTFAVVRHSFPVKEVGVVSGFANTGGFLSAVLLPSIFGNVLDHFHSLPSVVGYHYGFIIPALFSLCGILGGLLIKEKQKEMKPAVKSALS